MMETRAKVKARDLVWGWRQGRSTSSGNTNALNEIKRMEFHLIFAEAEGDFDEMFRLGLEMGKAAEYRIAQYQMEQIYTYQRALDPELKTARMWFSAMLINFVAQREGKEKRERMAVMDALRQGVRSKDPLAN